MPTKLKVFSLDKRDKAHQFLDHVVDKKKYPRAECREDWVRGEIVVWSGPEFEGDRPPPLEKTQHPQPESQDLKLALEDHEIDDIASRAAAKVIEALNSQGA